MMVKTCQEVNQMAITFGVVLGILHARNDKQAAKPAWRVIK
jgi:hypothetical protein